MKKRLLWGAVLVSFGALVIAGGIWLSKVFRSARIAAGAAAHIACSGLFVSQRPVDSLLAEDLELVRDGVTLTVNPDERLVSATALGGWVERSAYFRPGLGCTLLLGRTEEELEAEMIPSEILECEPPGDPGLVPGTAPPELEAVLAEAFEERAALGIRRTRAVVIVRDGKILAERYAPGFSAEMPLMGWSMTKTVTGILAGILVRDGRLALDEPISVPEWPPADERTRIPLRDFLWMSSGLEFLESYDDLWSDTPRMLFDESSAAGFVAQKPLKYSPGSHWAYSSGTTNLLSRAMRLASGKSRLDWLSFPRSELFCRTGMLSAVMEPDPSGDFVGSSFMYATARDWARLGQLYLNRGLWGDQEIVPREWLEFMREPAPAASRGRYGAHLWLNRGEAWDAGTRPWPVLPDGAYQASGFQGQFVTVVPSERLVVVRLGQTPNREAWSQAGFVANVLEALNQGQD